MLPMRTATTTSELSTTLTTTTIAGVLGAGIVGGVFYAFSAFVMPGLKRLPASEGIHAMQQINVTAQQPAFMLAFMGTTALCLYLGVRGFIDRGDTRATLLMAGALLYLVGSFGLTVAQNVPLNDALATVDPHAAGAAAHWQHFLSGWEWSNHVRGAASIGASGAFLAALLA
jgi:uncharacterized membrane protein